jgi:copper chaperone CopZ
MKALVEKQPGVQVADVSYSKGEARVFFDPNLTARDQLIAVIQKPGFRVICHS